jgi:hypothetical protein
MKRKIKEFTAYFENGEKVTIIVYKNFIDLAGNNSFEFEKSSPGIMELWTSDGQIVNKIEKGKYQIVDSGRYLISDDPDSV